MHQGIKKKKTQQSLLPQHLLYSFAEFVITLKKRWVLTALLRLGEGGYYSSTIRFPP